MHKTRLRWYGHVQQIGENSVIKWTLELRGRRKKRWLDQNKWTYGSQLNSRGRLEPQKMVPLDKNSGLCLVGLNAKRETNCRLLYFG